VPAAYYWSPTNGLGTGQPENWLTGPGIPHATHTYPPNGDDHLYFGPGWSGGNSDAYIRPSEGGVPLEFPPPVTELNFAGVHLLVGYTQRVTNQTGDLLVGTFNMHGGSLRQADSELMDRTDPPAEWPIDWEEGPGVTALTVRDWFSWTAGTINDGDLAGELNLAPGATGQAEPLDGGTVGLGSTLTLQGDEPTETGSTLSMIGGTFEVRNASSIVAAAFSTLLLQPNKKPTDPPTAIHKITVDDKDFTPKANGVIDIKPKSLAIVAPTVAVDGQAVLELKGEEAKFTNNGTTKIKQQTELKFTDLKEPQDCYYQNDKDAVTDLEGGSSITSNKKTAVDIVKGELKITHSVLNGEVKVAKMTFAPSVAAMLKIRKDATLRMSDSTDARLEIDGGDLSIYGTLSVAINPRGEQASHIKVSEGLNFHEIPNVSQAKMEVKHRSSGNADQRPVDATWHVATTVAGVVSGLPEMAENSTDYTPVAPFPVDQGKKLYVKRIN
jgi:putative sterol carrier protein